MAVDLIILICITVQQNGKSESKKYQLQIYYLKAGHYSISSMTIKDTLN